MGMGKLKTQPHILDKGDNMLNLTSYSANIYFTGIFKVNVYWQVGVMYKQTNTICKPTYTTYCTLIINCAIIMETKSRFSLNVYAISHRIWCKKHLRHTNTENMVNGKADTSDLMMTIARAIDIYFQSPKPNWASWTRSTPYIALWW